MSSSLATTAVPPPPSTPRQSGIARSSTRLGRLEAFGLSHTGVVRSSNEDSFLVAPGIGLYAVADGMGGAAAGDVASRMAVATVRAVVVDPDITCPRGLSPRPLALDLPLLVSAVEHANARVFAAANADKSMTGMGTTFTGLLVVEDRLALAHVGDSRAYLLRGGRLVQLTRDHTYLDALIRRGLITPEDAARSEHQHVITRAVGTEPALTVDGCLVAAMPGDTFLLASDGLHGVVRDDDIAATLLGEFDVTRAATRLIERACDAGGPDNITVVLLRVG